MAHMLASSIPTHNHKTRQQVERKQKFKKDDDLFLEQFHVYKPSSKWEHRHPLFYLMHWKFF